MAEIRSTAWGFLRRAGFSPHIQYTVIPLRCFLVSLQLSSCSCGQEKQCWATGSS